MRPFLVLAWLALVGVGTAAAQSDAPRRFAAAPDVAVRLVNLVGAVRVTGWDRDSVAVTGDVPAEYGSLMAGGTREAIKVAIEGPPPTTEYAGPTLEVFVPRRAHVAVKAAVASVTLSGLLGDVDAGVVNGRVRVEGAPRRVSAETILGDVECECASGDVRLRSASGTVVVRGSVGRLTVTTVTGGISVGGARLTAARLESTAGAIDVKGALARDGIIDVTTHEGAVTLRLPPATSALADLASTTGTFSTDFPMRGVRPVRGMPVQLTLGEGRGRIRVRTFTGAIRLQRQP